MRRRLIKGAVTMGSNSLSRDQQSKAITWLYKKWIKNKKKCEVCGTKQWILADDVVTPLVFRNHAVNIEDNLYPHFMVTCAECGNTKMFNAFISGLCASTADLEDE